MFLDRLDLVWLTQCCQLTLDLIAHLQVWLQEGLVTGQKIPTLTGFAVFYCETLRGSHLYGGAFGGNAGRVPVRD